MENLPDDQPLGFENRNSGPLKDGDYTLEEGAAWIETAPFSIRIQKTPEGVVVDIYQTGKEMETSIASAYAFTGDLDTHEDFDESIEEPNP